MCSKNLWEDDFRNTGIQYILGLIVFMAIVYGIILFCTDVFGTVKTPDWSKKAALEIALLQFDEKSIVLETLIDAIEEAESGGDPNAISPVGARGSCQIMEATWKEVMPEYSWKEAYDRNLSKLACKRYIVKIKKYLTNSMIKDSLLNVMLCYNWGIGNVRKWHKKGANYDNIPESTKRYYEKILSNMPESEQIAVSYLF